ncbi:hypothetical protein [Paraburkholderia fungorum]|uniref:Uncharacterized protein n=1 Tax=Paraburkholderia fungorum TaxID=134537 RepID=A0AAW3UUG5_9BURK|nr:hypothetical protein [Paraburkholderia fungorum]MBB4513178.1 hypothetical protein [Paraburkholderia fungorum]MBB6201396.1 hypothetical protein [Paraburkholderia fungorum]
MFRSSTYVDFRQKLTWRLAQSLLRRFEVLHLLPELADFFADPTRIRLGNIGLSPICVFIAQRYRAMLSSTCCRRALTFALVKSRSRLLTALNLLPSMAKKYVQAVGFKTDGGAWAGVAPSAG